jgi:broad specificity phosphatase PhoE
MKISIRPADLHQDRQLLISMLSQYLRPGCDDLSFDWRYHHNPHGPARAWLAVDDDSETGEPVGVSAAFPRHAQVNGAAKTGWVLGDFCISDKYRTLGPALQLQRATLASVGEHADADFCYDFPSRQLTAIYQRLRIQPAASIIRLAKPLRVDEKFRKLKPVVWLGNSLLQLSDYKNSRKHRWEIDIHQGECGEEFTQLLKRSHAAAQVSIVRSAEYLNWRYLAHPVIRHQIITARKAGELAGYLVFSLDEENVKNARISEWCCADDNHLLTAFIGEAARRLRRAGVMTLSAFLSEKDPRLPLLRKLGFWPRESSPIMMHWNNSATDFFPMHGDRDM